MTAAWKECGCGARYTRVEWRSLRLTGYIELEQREDEPGGIYELRGCRKCRSTISVQVERDAVIATAPFARL